MQYASKRWPTGRAPELHALAQAEAGFLAASARFGPDGAQAIAAGIALRLLERPSPRKPPA